MYLLTKSETINSGVTVTLSGVTDADSIIDGDLTTSVETATLAPTLTIDLGSAKTVDTIFLKGENLNDYTISASTDNSTYTEIEADITVPEHGNSFAMFDNSTAYRYWRTSFSARTSSEPAYRIHEVYLSKLSLDLNTAEKRPLRYRYQIPRTGVVAFETYNQRTVSYKIGDEEKVRLRFEWQNLEEEVAADLERLWKGSPHAPSFLLYPRPDAEPEIILRVKWQDRFGFRYAEYGKRGEAVFEEL